MWHILSNRKKYLKLISRTKKMLQIEKMIHFLIYCKKLFNFKLKSISQVHASRQSTPYSGAHTLYISRLSVDGTFTLKFYRDRLYAFKAVRNNLVDIEKVRH